MEVRPLAMVAFLVFQAIIATAPPTTQAQSQQLEMGYGPAVLSPVSDGLPVYTTGDQVWMLSDYQSPLEIALNPPLGVSVPPITALLQPGVPALIHTFEDSDAPGYWNLELVNGSVKVGSVLLVPAQSTNFTLSAEGYSIQGGVLAVNMSTGSSSGSGFYDAQACALGSGDASTVLVQVPSAAGGGELQLRRVGGSVAVSQAGVGTKNFTFWFELRRDYSYLSPASSNVLVTRSVRVGESDAVPLSRSSGNTVVNVSLNVVLQPGRYDLRSYFENSNGIAVTDTELLIRGGKSWVWLGGCAMSDVSGSQFTLRSSLSGDPSRWPRTVYFLFRVSGVEAYASANLSIALAEARFYAAPWGGDLKEYKLSATPLSGVSQIAVANGTLYAALAAGEGSAAYTFSLGKRTVFTGAVEPLAPFSVARILINVSRATVTLLSEGKPVEGGRVEVSDSGGLLESESTDSAGKVVFYLPPGNYTILGSGMNETASQNLALGYVQSAEVNLELSGVFQTIGTLLAVLVALAVAGVAVNLWAWRRGRPRRPLPR